MSIELKRQVLIAKAKASGIWTIHVIPPFTRALWALGIEIAPPCFWSFMNAFLVATLSLATAEGLVFAALHADLGLWQTLAAIVPPSVLFGLALAFYWRRVKTRLNLSDWESYGR